VAQLSDKWNCIAYYVELKGFMGKCPWCVNVSLSIDLYLYHLSFLSFSLCLNSSQHVCVWLTATLTAWLL